MAKDGLNRTPHRITHLSETSWFPVPAVQRASRATREESCGVVPSFRSSTTSPRSSNTQYQLERSPRSKPIVSFCSEKFLLCFVATVLIFFIAGLLYLLCFEHVDNLGAYSIPLETGLLIPSVCIS
jgi:hypothetical protein